MQRLIQAGVGGWGASWVERVLRSPTWELAACVDVDAGAIAAIQAKHGIAPERCFASLTEAAAAVDADAALVVVPPGVHQPVAVEAIDAGLHVLIEKPLTHTIASAIELVRYAEDKERLLMVSQNYRYRRAPRAVTSLLKQEWLGEIASATVICRKAPHFTRPDVRHGDSHYKFIEDQCIHHFDQIRGILGDEPVAVYAQDRNPEWSWFAAPPVVAAVIELERGGLVHFFGSWLSRATDTTWDGAWYIDCEGGEVEWIHNSVRVHPENVVTVEGFTERDQWMEADLFPDGPEDRDYILSEFASCIEENRIPETSGRDNLMSIALTQAVLDSAQTGERRLIASYLDS